MARICEKNGCTEKAVEGKNLCPAHLSKRRSFFGKLVKHGVPALVFVGGLATYLKKKSG